MTETAQKKRGLGMGLSALLGTETSEGLDGNSNETRKLPVAFLIPSPLQPRRHFDEDELAILSQSIREHGILQPLAVRAVNNIGHQFEIIAGERRWRAAQLAGLHDVPVVVHELSDKQVLQAALIENLQREDLSAVEEAEAYNRLISEFGYTQEQVGESIGKSRSHITNTLRLLKLPEDIQNMIMDGKLSAGHARCLLTAKDPTALAEAVISRNLSVRELEALVAAEKAVNKAPSRAPKPEKDPDMLACERRLTDQLGLKVDMQTSRKGGRLTIHFTESGQLDFLLQRLLSTS